MQRRKVLCHHRARPTCPILSSPFIASVQVTRRDQGLYLDRPTVSCTSSSQKRFVLLAKLSPSRMKEKVGAMPVRTSVSYFSDFSPSFTHGEVGAQEASSVIVSRICAPIYSRAGSRFSSHVQTPRDSERIKTSGYPTLSLSPPFTCLCMPSSVSSWALRYAASISSISTCRPLFGNNSYAIPNSIAIT